MTVGLCGHEFSRQKGEKILSYCDTLLSSTSQKCALIPFHISCPCCPCPHPAHERGAQGAAGTHGRSACRPPSAGNCGGTGTGAGSVSPAHSRARSRRCLWRRSSPLQGKGHEIHREMLCRLARFFSEGKAKLTCL